MYSHQAARSGSVRPGGPGWTCDDQRTGYSANASAAGWWAHLDLEQYGTVRWRNTVVQGVPCRQALVQAGPTLKCLGGASCQVLEPR